MYFFCFNLDGIKLFKRWRLAIIIFMLPNMVKNFRNSLVIKNLLISILSIKNLLMLEELLIRSSFYF